ncbi:4-hydroxy-tetrahydrodipicolinate synthase [Candidatus Bathyarchaeota archaeon]|nr:4-hydroxy-tetrahydrodipicolinate synthase [Candidatus Bathyarchaeota archaeon]
MLSLEGIFVPNVTPFNHKGEIMYDALDDLVNYWIEAGISGVIANASTGEAPYLSDEERKRIIEYLVEHTGDKIKVCAGTGAPSTWKTIELTRAARDTGAEAALITTPYFFKPDDKEITRYFIDVINAVDLPVILYNVPKFTGYNVNPQVVASIAEECSGLVAIKDSSGNPGNMAEVIRLCGDKIDCLSGSADMILPTLMLGGKGAIVAVGNIIPEECTEIYRSYKNKDKINAGEYQLKASYVNKVLVRELPQIAAIKTALNQRGFNAGTPRKPLTELGESTKKHIEEAMRLV